VVRGSSSKVSFCTAAVPRGAIPNACPTAAPLPTTGKEPASIQRNIADWIDAGRTVSPRVADPHALPELVDDVTAVPRHQTDEQP
jgi:hypothetical protein